MSARTDTEKLDEWTRGDLLEYGRDRLGFDLVDRRGVFTPKAFNQQAIILEKFMAKRGLTRTEWIMCVDYCATVKKLVERPAGVFTFLRDARKELHSRPAPLTDLAKEIVQAVIAERQGRGDESWCDRLLLARGNYRREVLAEWNASR